MKITTKNTNEMISHKDSKIKNYSGFGLKPIFYSGFG
jgi:hypothetical protein